MNPRDKAIRYQSHATQSMRRRGVTEVQVERTIRHPDRTRPAKRRNARRFERKLSKKSTVVVIADERPNEFWVVTAWKK